MSWKPTPEKIKTSNIGKIMQKHGFSNYEDFWKWSVTNKEAFWSSTIEELDIIQHKKYEQIVNTEDGVENATWLYNASLNIVDSCFKNDGDAIAISYQKTNKPLQKITQKELLLLVNKIANSFTNFNLKIGDCIAINLPMTLESVAIYIAAVKAGMQVATVADSFSTKEIKTRFEITKPKLAFTQNVVVRANKVLPLYEKVAATSVKNIVVIPEEKYVINLRKQDVLWGNFLSEDPVFESIKSGPQETTTILFSSGTTATPKAIPWNHTTPIKAAADAFYYQNIQKNDVVCWPTNLGWMMGPWLVFAALINKASIALYYDAPTSKSFGKFIEEAKVTMLGVIPSIVKQWKKSNCMEQFDWTHIKCFSSTGEVSNPKEMKYLIELAGNKPIIEYCGGTEIGGGYMTSAIVQENSPSTFSTKTLGGDFIILDENHNESKKGEVFLIPPILGLSTRLINKNHHDIYYKNTPKANVLLRRHGDEIQELENGYFKILGRIDDAMNLGGIKVSATQIEEVLNQLNFISECAAVAIAQKNVGPSKLILFYSEKNKELNDNDRLKAAQAIIKKEINPLFKVTDLVKIDKLPRTASHKIMRRTLKDNYNK